MRNKNSGEKEEPSRENLWPTKTSGYGFLNKKWDPQHYQHTVWLFFSIVTIVRSKLREHVNMLKAISSLVNKNNKDLANTNRSKTKPCWLSYLRKKSVNFLTQSGYKYVHTKFTKGWSTRWSLCPNNQHRCEEQLNRFLGTMKTVQQFQAVKVEIFGLL